MAHSYASISDAARAVLCEATAIATGAGQPFVVVGGWSPLLLNSGAIVHPGTRDVDLLFERGTNQGALEDVLHAFLKNGYLSSAKHQFQILRVVRVADREFVFNVDFLHSAEVTNPEELFVDHLVLDDGPLLYRYQSIVVPMSSLLFEDAGRTSIGVSAVTPAGDERSVDVPLMSELGTLLTKSKSMSQAKRSRDAFDVFLAIIQARNIDDLKGQIRENCIEDRLEDLWLLVTDVRLRRNVGRYWPQATTDAEWDPMAKRIRTFLDDSGIEEPEKE